MNTVAMRRMLGLLAVTAVLTLSTTFPAAAGEPAVEVRQAAERFYAALNTLFTGDAGPMAEVWSHAGDVTYMGPFGKILVGWKDVGASWEAQARLELGGRVEPVDLHVVATESLGVTVGYEQGTNYPDGKTVEVHIRATNVFRREGGEWKMIGHHTDLLRGVRAESRGQ